jgi:hypothetical protein
MNLSDLADCRVEQHNINIVVQFRLHLGAKLFECPALHSASRRQRFQFVNQNLPGTQMSGNRPSSRFSLAWRE